MFLSDQNSLVTLTPDFPPPACGATRFRWTMHVALPFPLPSKSCIAREVMVDGSRYHFSVHNHFDRCIRVPRQPGAVPQVFLIQKTCGLHPGDNRELLQSVAVFNEITEHEQPKIAFQGADKKVIACFGYLTDFLVSIQKSVPYLVTWLVYPVSLFDIGTVHHSVEHFCPTVNQWQLVGSGVTINAARQMRAPLFLLESEQQPILHPQLDLSNELLAEAQLAMFRGMRRLSVLNSYVAIELFANAVLKQKKVDQLVAAGSSQADAELGAEEQRKRNRTKAEFLLHKGLQAACGRSLCVEDKALYDKILKLQGLRNETAHAGRQIDAVTAKEGHCTGCEAVRWLASVAGVPVKPMLPDTNEAVQGFATFSNDNHTCSPAEIELIRRLFDIVSIKPDAGPKA